MFQDPKADSSPIEPGRYCVKLVKLEPLPPNPEHLDWAPQVRWYMNVAEYPSMTVVRDKTTELPVELWQYTSIAMTPKSKARPWVEAFLGRALVDGQDTGEAIGGALIGRKAIVLIGLNQAGRTAILSIQPLVEPTKNGAGKAKAAAVSANVAALEEDLPPAQRSGSLLTEEEMAGAF